MTESMGITPESHGQDLPAGSNLQEFVVEKTIGFGGFGITYLAHDTSLGRKVVIKEHLPDAFSFRDVSAMTVRPRHTSGETMENYQWSMGSFMREAEMLAALDHPNIVRVLRRFEANGTAYFVMPFVEGQSFDKVIDDRRNGGGHFGEAELRVLLEALLDAFIYLHGQGVYHRDVKPGNILLTADGRPVLIDFGAARQHLGQKSMTVIESAGYTPFEQTESRGNVGPWSDLYALGGVLRKAITFETPARSADRIRRDPMTDLAHDPACNQRFSQFFLQSVDRALRVNEEDRWQDGRQWLDHLRGQAQVMAVSAPSAPHEPEPEFVSATLSPIAVPETHKSISPASKTPKLITPPLGRSRSEAREPPLPQAQRKKPPKNKQGSKVVLTLTLIILVGGAGFAGWWVMQAQTPGNSGTGEAITPATALESERLKPTEPERIRVPAESEWEKLAASGDPFACALLGEAILTAGAGTADDSSKAMALLATSAEAGHPLGMFLLAETRQSGSEGSAGFSEAFRRGFETSAIEGGPVWHAAIGRAYLRGMGIGRNPQKAFEWLKTAADGGHVGSQLRVGEMIEAGEGTAANEREALRYLEKAAGRGHTGAIVHAARLRHSGDESLRDPRKALEWARQAAADGDPVGMGLLGDLLESGAGGSVQTVEAFHWYRQAAEMEDAFAMGRMGRMLMNGSGCEQNDSEAFRWLRKAAEQGDKASSHALGLLYETGRGGIENPARAVELYRSGVEAGDVNAIGALARCADQGVGMTENPTEAARLYEMAADKGNHEAAFRLGMLLLDGRGVSKDESKAFQLIQTAAKEGNSEALFQMARCLEKGLGTDKNETSAIKAYQDAARDDLPEACFRLALMLEEGRGASKDETAAVRWYRTAAEKGHIGSQVNLGLLHAQGKGTKQNEEEALKWYAMAAGQDDVDALVLLGMMHQLGLGTQRSPEEAAKFYRKAASQSDAEAEKLLKQLSQ